MISFKQFLQKKDCVKICVCTAHIPFSTYSEMFEACNYICLLGADDERRKNFRKCFPKHARLIISENLSTVQDIKRHFQTKGYRKISMVSNDKLSECTLFDIAISKPTTFAQFANQINNIEIALKLWKNYETIDRI